MDGLAETLLIDPFGAAIQDASPGLRRKVLHYLKLDLLDFRQPLPLPRQDVIDLFMQMADFKLGLRR